MLRLLTGELEPAAGTIKRGTTLKIGYLSQALTELDGGERVIDAVENRRRVTELAGGREISADTLLKDFGFIGDKLTARLADLSGGERRRLQFLRLLLDEPNVLLLDEPTNDLDIDTLTVIEDYLDGWPGTLIVVTHDRYFLERVSDVTYALTGGGRCDLLPGGIEQYLAERAAAAPAPVRPEPSRDETASARERRAGKEMARIERQLAKLDERIAALHESMADAAADHVRIGELNVELSELLARKESLEEAWFPPLTSDRTAYDASMRYLLRPFALWRRYFPQLAACYLLGVLGRRAAIELAALVGYDNNLWTSLIMPFAGLARLGSYVAMFLVLRPAIPALAALPAARPGESMCSRRHRAVLRDLSGLEAVRRGLARFRAAGTRVPRRLRR